MNLEQNKKARKRNRLQIQTKGCRKKTHNNGKANSRRAQKSLKKYANKFAGLHQPITGRFCYQPYPEKDVRNMVDFKTIKINREVIITVLL